MQETIMAGINALMGKEGQAEQQNRAASNKVINSTIAMKKEPAETLLAQKTLWD